MQILAEMGLKDDMNRFIVTRNTTPYTTARARLIRYRYFSERCTDGLVALDDLGDPLEHDSTRCHMATIMADFDRIIIAQHCLAGLKKPHLSRLGQVRAHCAIYAAKQRLAEDQAARGDSST